MIFSSVVYIMTYSWKKGMSIDDQWQSWRDNNPLDKIEAPDTETLKEAVIKDLEKVYLNMKIVKAIYKRHTLMV